MSYYYPFREYFEPRMDAPCPKTDALIRSGFQQKSGGYIQYAKECGLDVDYKQSLPNQGWHFIRSYLDRIDPEKAHIEQIICGELLFWMAEVSEALTETELDDLAEKVRNTNEKSGREKANKLIKDKCFPRVLEIVMNSYNKTVKEDRR